MRRLDARDLAAELGADRAAGARHEHDLALQVVGDRLEVDLDGLAPEHVLDLDGAQLAGEVARRPRRDRRALGSVLTGTSSGARRLDDPRAQLARGGRDRDQHLVRPSVADDVREVGGRAEHADAVEAQVALARVVVEQADRRVAERRGALHLLHDELAGVAGADDDRLLAARHDPAGQRPLDDRPREQP